MSVTEILTTLLGSNELPPLSRIGPDSGTAEETETLCREIVERWLPDLPRPHPDPFFDKESARKAARLLHAAMGRLKEGNPGGTELVGAVADLPSADTPARHLTQAAILWNAVPIARRFQSDAFQALNRDKMGAEGKEALGELLTGTLASLPLLSLRTEAEEFFSHSAPPSLKGLRACLGFDRWLAERLASDTESESVWRRRSRMVAVLLEGGSEGERALRDVLYLREQASGPTPDIFLFEFIPFLSSGRWPEDLASGLRALADKLRKPPLEETDDQPDPLV